MYINLWFFTKKINVFFTFDFRLSANQNGFLTPRANKDVNLVNVPANPPPKKDNLDISKDFNIASDGTLQKIKKTYI